MTVRDALRAARNRLAAAGVSSPDLDAALLLADVLGVKRERLALDPERTLTAEVGARFDALVARRERREPMAHIRGRAEFWSLEFKVTKDTLSPRPETEMLVEEAVKALRGVERPVVVDIGTGTGCIAVAIAKEVPSATVHAVDISPAALAVARENVRRHGVEARVHLHLGDMFAPLAGVLAPGSVDVVVSNPPYVRRNEEFDPEILFEPELALFVDDVPAMYRRIAEGAAAFVRSGGSLLLELPGAGTAAILDAVRDSNGWLDVSSRADLAKLPRVVVARRRGAHAVALVMDPEFGDRLIALSRRLHVWIVATPANQAVAERIWRADGGGSSLERGVTTFPSDPGVPRDELASRYLDTIEDHHGPYSHTPPWTVLEVFGAPPTAELSAALGDLGFSRVEPTSDGFVATRTEADAR